MNQTPSFAVGLALAAVVAAAAYRARSLSASGAVAAAICGTVAVGAGWSWGIVLIAYFVSATLLSRFRARDKERRTAGRIEKAGARDAAQVLANGGVFSAMALAYWIDPGPLWRALGAGALAASAADTWATEIGVLARVLPRSILGGQPVATGTSGGVTVQGLIAGLAGAAFMAQLTRLVAWPVDATVAALAGGMLGCLLDSVAGAALQARRWCVTCGTATERPIHTCGSATRVTGGLPWLDNDGVNALATVGGAILGAAAGSLFLRYGV